MEPSQTQPARNISGIFAECSLCVAMFRAFRKHLGNILKENMFKKLLNGNVVFVLKVYDLAITNVDLLENSSNPSVHLGFSESRGPNFRKGANQYKTKRNEYKSYIGDNSLIIKSYKIRYTYDWRLKIFSRR